MTTVQHFVNGLKSYNRDEQNKAAGDLILRVKTELREIPQDELAQFLDDFNHHIFDIRYDDLFCHHTKMFIHG